MKKIFILATSVSVLIFSNSEMRAQTVSSQKGLITAEFNMPQGKIRIFLPDDIRPGETISGRIKTEALGKNARQIGKNLSALLQNSLVIDGVQFKPVGDNAVFSLNAKRTLSGKIVMLDASGRSEERRVGKGV